MKSSRRFIRCFSQSHNFIEHVFVVIPIKGAEKIYGKMFKRVYGSNEKCVTPFPYTPFERMSEQPTSNFLAMNIVLCAKFKEMSGVPKECCFTLTTEFKI